MSEPIFTQKERSVAELEPNAINPRTLKDKAFKELQRSLEKDPHFLKARPIIVSMAEGREGTVIAGNQRLAAAKALGWATVPVVEVRGSTEEQEKEWMVKDNLHKGEWDFDKLANGFDLEFLQEMGLDEKELNKILAHTDHAEDDEFDAEKEAETITAPTVQRGDIWQLGEHRLMCGDSTKKEDIERLMDGKKAQCVLTDPPYGQNQEGVTNDEPEKLQTIIRGAVEGLPVDNGAVVAFQSPRTFTEWLDAIRKSGFKFERMMWMYKQAQMAKPWRGWILKSEAIIIASKGLPMWNEVNPYSHDCYLLTEVSGELPEGIGWHGSVKPIRVVSDILSRISVTGGICFEPFCGSGTTLIACENTKRVCYGMEIDPKYCDVIIKRWEEKTGTKAVKVQV